MYEYRIKEFVKIYDGDTITVVIDLGFGTYRKESLRLARINAPEVRGDEREEGLKSRDWLRNLVADAIESGYDMRVKTQKDSKGKYGRYLAELFIDFTCVNDKLVESGHATYKEY